MPPVEAAVLLLVEEVDCVERVVLAAVVVADVVAGFDEVTLEDAVAVAVPGTHWSGIVKESCESRPWSWPPTSPLLNQDVQ